MYQKVHHVAPGEQYGKWTVLHQVHEDKGVRLHNFWLCRCECGSTHLVRANTLTKGRSTRCRTCPLYPRNKTHGHTRGKGVSPTWQAWTQMRYRCNNPRCKHYANYGGRGIRCCEAWNSFQTFLADMGERPSAKHSIDRIDNDGDYEPGNCRWATSHEQQNNKRTSVFLTFNGKTISVAQWSRETGIPVSTLHNRILRGWSTEEILTLPRSRTRRIYR